MDPDQQAQTLNRLEALLEKARSRRETLTYLEAADALGVPGPHRIHKTTRLIERLMSRDCAAERLPRSALVISRTRAGRPAPGFFEQAEELGLFDGSDPDAFHERLLDQLFGADQS